MRRRVIITNTNKILSVMPNVHVDPEFDDLVPRMAEPIFDEFVKLIEEHGYDKPIIDVLPDGAILDGRHRFLAAKKLGGKYQQQLQYRVLKMNRIDAIDYVFRSNKGRNNLSKSQLAMMAAKRLQQVSKYREKAKANQAKFRGNQFTNKKVESGSPEPDSTMSTKDSNRSSIQAAKEVGVSKASVVRAAKIDREDPKAAKRVVDGKETIFHAYNNLASQKAKQKKTEASGEAKSVEHKVPEQPKPQPKQPARPKFDKKLEKHDQYEMSKAQLKRNQATLKEPKGFKRLRTEGKQAAYMAVINMKDLFPDVASVIEDYHEGIEDAWITLKEIFPDKAEYLEKQFDYLYQVMHKED